MRQPDDRKYIVLGKSLQQIRNFAHAHLHIASHVNFEYQITPVVCERDYDRTIGLDRSVAMYVLSGGLNEKLKLDKVAAALMRDGHPVLAAPEEWTR